MESETVLDVCAIKEILPHRYPFLLVDKVIELNEGQNIVAIKMVSANEAYFNGHFPARPVMPGVLVIEALAQSAAILAKCSPGHGAGPGKEFFLVGLEDVKWRRQVSPGDELRLHVGWEKRKGPLLLVRGEAFVRGELCASATIKAAESDLV
ncbi:MAG: 3-hydroxyacyl-ACP dehydratase FabZ [Bdellovibrionales bacterium]|nr:3-hydroxyacyl-ACP dehydratase FabZ [Bdellovibrionales bacterium]